MLGRDVLVRKLCMKTLKVIGLITELNPEEVYFLVTRVMYLHSEKFHLGNLLWEASGHGRACPVCQRVQKTSL